jgi:hypothetical protein
MHVSHLKISVNIKFYILFDTRYFVKYPAVYNISSKILDRIPENGLGYPVTDYTFKPDIWPDTDFYIRLKIGYLDTWYHI